MVDKLIPFAFGASSLLNIATRSGTACGGEGYHKFCSPSTSKLPTCGWTSQYNGKCEGECPSGYTEVGIRSQYCEGGLSGQGQALCCTYDDTNHAIGSTALYGTCLWSQWPSCDYGSCPSGFPSLFSSTTKNGGAVCNPRSSGVIDGFFAVGSYQEAKYCCSSSDPQKQWTNCEIPTTGSLVAAGFSLRNHCSSSCPSQKTRVSLDCYGSQCLGRGGGVPQCCMSGYFVDDPTDTVDEAALREKLTSFLKAPQCVDKSVFEKRGDTDIPSNDFLEDMLADAIGKIAKSAAQVIVDQVLKKEGYVCSSISSYRVYKQSTYNLRSVSNKKYARQILCSVKYFECLLCRTCKSCVDGTCGGPIDPHTSINLDAECADEDDGDGSKMKTFVQKREKVQYSSHDIYFPGDLKNSLQKRRGIRRRSFVYAGRPGSIPYIEQAYISAGQWDPADPIYHRIFDYENEGDCVNPRIVHINPDLLPILIPKPHYYQTEHIIEFQGIKTLFEYLSDRDIVMGGTLPVTPYDFFALGFNSEILPAASPAILPIPFVQNPDANGQIPSDRIMDALGSTWNNGNFVLLRDTLNGMKSRMWAGTQLVDETKMTGFVSNAPGTAISYIRRAVAVTHYLNSSIVMSRLQNICNLIRQQLVMIEDEWQVPGPNRNVLLSDSWDAYISYQMPKMVERADVFARKWLKELKDVYAARPADSDKVMVLQSVGVLDVHRQDMVQTGLHVAGYP